MKKAAILVIAMLLLPPVLAQPPMMAREIFRVDGRGGDILIPAEIKVSGTMNMKNTTLTYEHRISNPYNETLKFTLGYGFTGEPDLLEVYVDGKQATLETVQEDAYRSRYRLHLSIDKNESIKIISKMSYPSIPERYRRGLWGNYYTISPSLNIEQTGLGRRIYLYGSIAGEIKLPTGIKKVRCSECRYDKDKNTAIVNLEYRSYPSFSINFQSSRIPVKAGAFYIFMLTIVFGLVIRGRRRA